MLAKTLAAHGVAHEVVGTLDAAVPAGSRVLRLARCRLDHDAVDLYWHTPELVEIPLTLRRLPEPRGNDRITYTPS